MEVDKHRNVLHDRVSGCQSFSSNYHPSGQLRKISIGVTAEASPKIRPRARREDEFVLPDNEKNVSSQGKSAEECCSGLEATSKGKKAEVPDQEMSAWIPTQSFHQETGTAKTVQFFENKRILESGGRKREKSGDAELEEFTFTKMQEIHAPDKEKCGEELEKSAKGGSEALKMKLWEILGAAPSQDEQTSHSLATKTELKILKSQRNRDLKAEAAKPKQNSDPIETDSESPNQTIKRPVTRSLTRKKAQAKHQPKLQLANNNDGSFLPALSTHFKQKQQEKNIFAFDEAEARAGNLSLARNGYASLSKMEKTEKKITRIEHDQSSFTRKGVSDSLQPAEKEKMPKLPAEKPAPKSNKVEDFHKPSSKKNKHPLQPKNSFLDDEFHHSQVTKRKDPQDLSSLSQNNADQQKSFSDSPARKNMKSCIYFNSPSPKNADLQENFDSPLPAKKDPQIDFQSPTFAMDTPLGNDFLSTPLPKSTPIEEAFNSPTLDEREFMEKRLHSTRAKQISRLGSSDSDTYTESSDDTSEFTKPSKELSPVTQGKNAKKRLSLSSMDEHDSEMSEGHELIDKGFRTIERSPSGTHSPEEPSFILPRNKRFCSPDDVKLSDLNPTSSLPKGDGDSNGCQGGSEQNQENGLARLLFSTVTDYHQLDITLMIRTKYPQPVSMPMYGILRLSDGAVRSQDIIFPTVACFEISQIGRAIAQFALVLERFKSKMKSQTGKKSSEILASVADRMHLQLQNIESRIQMDVRKFAGLCKSERKRLESRFQEEQERLKLIHDKFKQEVNQHLHRCRSAIEEFEAYQIKLKGNAERQKASHRKLLLETEEAIRIQLSDAERSIVAIHTASREKMQGLKHVLMEFLNECTYS